MQFTRFNPIISRSFARVSLAFFSIAAVAACNTPQVTQDVPMNDAVVSDSAPAFPEHRSSAARASSMPADLPTLISDNTDFAFALNRVALPAAGNTVFSPHSISVALAMTRAGAVGVTGTEMDTALRFTLPGARLHQAFNALTLSLAERPAVATSMDSAPDPERPALRLTWANDIWVEPSETMVPSYLDTLAMYYGAGAHIAPFLTNPSAARTMINQWVSDRTSARIPELLPESAIDRHVKVVVTNAVYFNARWRSPFEMRATSDAAFTRLDGSTVNVPMMARAAPVQAPFAETAEWSAAEFPYQGDQLAMVVVVPAAGTFAAFESGLDGAKYRSIVSALAPRPVSANLPRFRARQKIELKNALQSLGMNAAFADADFSAMIQGPVQIKEVYHQGFIDVAEAGSEAAAATAVVLYDGSVALNPAQLIANRPFYFFIRDRVTGAVLFVGRVLDPSLPAS